MSLRRMEFAADIALAEINCVGKGTEANSRLVRVAEIMISLRFSTSVESKTTSVEAWEKSHCVTQNKINKESLIQRINYNLYWTVR